MGNYPAVCVSVVLVIHIYRRHCKVSIDISNFTDINTDINTVFAFMSYTELNSTNREYWDEFP